MSGSTRPIVVQDRVGFKRRTVLQAISLAGLSVFGSQSAYAGGSFPDTIPLPTGFQPEGIVTGRGHEFFVGSLAGGAIYRGDFRTGKGSILVPSVEGQVAVGLSHDSRRNHLFVAGDGTGKAFVYDAATGDTVKTYTLTASGTFVNDVVATSTAAYFTDSFHPVLYKLPLGPAGQLPEQDDIEEISLGGEFMHVPGEFNANGIDAPPHEEYLIIVNSSTGLLYKVAPASGDASEIDLGSEELTAGDGILLDGRTLYVVRNQFNEIAVVRLEPGASTGDVVGTITNADFNIPTTIAEFGNHLYAVNARFGVTDPNAEYDITRVPKKLDSSP